MDASKLDRSASIVNYGCYISKKFGIKKYNSNAFRKQQETYATFISSNDKSLIISDFNHGEPVSYNFYNLFNKVDQNNDFIKKW